jgi:parallel beta-helix repeat protein
VRQQRNKKGYAFKGEGCYKVVLRGKEMQTESLLRKGLAIGIILLFVGTCIIPAVAQNTEKTLPTSRGDWLYVGGSGPGNYTTIQSALDAANPGDTVFVFNGIYYENAYIETSIHLIGEDKNNTIIDGGGVQGSTVVFHANYIYLSGFTIRNCGDWANDGGVWITDAWSHHSSFNTVTNNIICNNQKPGIIAYQTNNNTITNNIFLDNVCAIEFGSYSYYNVISQNTFINNSIGMWGAPAHTMISNNYFKNSGISISRGGSNTIKNNQFEGDGSISISLSSGCLIQNNFLISPKTLGTRVSSSYGIAISSSVNVVVKNNIMGSKGIIISGENIEHWNTHTIENNYADNKLVYYYKNLNNVDVPSNASNIILANCNCFRIKNLTIENAVGLQLGFSSFNIISDNTILNSMSSGIRLYSSSQNNISRNIINNSSEDGIIIEGNSILNTIFDNTISNSTRNGINLIANSYNNKIIKNKILFNKQYGLYMGGNNDFNYIFYNEIRKNSDAGVYVIGFFNTIYKNSLMSNKDGVFLFYSYNNSITENNFINNENQIIFVLDYRSVHSNFWDANYFDDKIGFMPRVIVGIVRTRFSFSFYYGSVIYIYRLGFNIDWNPSLIPYDMGEFV